MKNKIKNIKKCVLMMVTMVCGVVASNAISDSEMVTTTYASDFFIDADGLEFKPGSDGKVTLSKDNTKNPAEILNSIIKLIKWISLVGTIVLLGVFVYNLIRMGASGTNVQNRAAAQQAMVWSGMSAAGLTIATSVFFFIGSVFS